MNRLPLLVCCVLLSGLLVGCQVPAPVTSSEPTVVGTGPTPMCTPTPSGGATPCTAAELAEKQRVDALYAEAERVFRRFAAEDARLTIDGAEADAAVLAPLADPFRSFYIKARQSQHADGLTGKGSYLITFVRPAPGQSIPGSEVALEQCVDGSQVIGYVGKTAIGPDSIVKGYTYYKHEGGVLKLFEMKASRVASC